MRAWPDHYRTVLLALCQSWPYVCERVALRNRLVPGQMTRLQFSTALRWLVYYEVVEREYVDGVEFYTIPWAAMKAMEVMGFIIP